VSIVFYFHFLFVLLLHTNKMLFISCMCPSSNNLTKIVDSSVNYYYLTVIIWMKNKVFLMRLFLFLCHVKNLFLIYAGSHINIITDQWWCLQSFPNKFDFLYLWKLIFLHKVVLWTNRLHILLWIILFIFEFWIYVTLPGQIVLIYISLYFTNDWI
jgi:hypothetical protein